MLSLFDELGVLGELQPGVLGELVEVGGVALSTLPLSLILELSSLLWELSESSVEVFLSHRISLALLGGLIGTSESVSDESFSITWARAVSC